MTTASPPPAAIRRARRRPARPVGRAARAPRRVPVAPIASEALFARRPAKCRSLHRGSLYRLKQTALGKLILTK